MNRNALIQHVDLWKSKLGSYSAVANKCNISASALSTILASKYGANEDLMLQKIAKALNYQEATWKLVRTIHNYRVIENVYNDAKTESMWFAISNPAGSCKSKTLEDLFNRDTTGTVIYIQCEEWGAKQFLTKLITQVLGEEEFLKHKGYLGVPRLTDIVANYFNDMSLDRPVLIIDEADKLKSSARLALIPLYNRTENRLGVILSGTENFAKDIKKGVRLSKKGYDELESRFGRTYISLRGASRKEVGEICAANGVTDKEAQERIWGNLPKVEKWVEVSTPGGTKSAQVPFVEDFRLMARLVKREVLGARRAA